MKICIAVAEAKGLESKLSAHFGSAPYFAIYDTESNELSCLSNANEHHKHGQCQPLQALHGLGIEVVISGGIGERAVAALNSAGIAVYRAQRSSAAQALDALRSNALSLVTPEEACRKHSCD